MRYYVVLSETEDGRPYVVAETVRDAVDDADDRMASLASGIGGAKARILTEDELEAEMGGVVALEEWRERDDHRFDEVTRVREAATRLVGEYPALYLVRPVDSGAAPRPANTSNENG
jgi:hypothetical protein